MHAATAHTRVLLQALTESSGHGAWCHSGYVDTPTNRKLPVIVARDNTHFLSAHNSQGNISF